jgi:hypothetical protein
MKHMQSFFSLSLKRPFVTYRLRRKTSTITCLKEIRRKDVDCIQMALGMVCNLLSVYTATNSQVA